MSQNISKNDASNDRETDDQDDIQQGDAEDLRLAMLGMLAMEDKDSAEDDNADLEDTADSSHDADTGEDADSGARSRSYDTVDPSISGLRLQKVLASAGIGSRRACEQLIDEGRVEIDGQIVLEQGRRVDPSRQVIRVDGMRIPTAPGHVVLALNKPRGVHSTMSDDQGRPCVGDILKGRKERLFHVGRLDADTEGLLLLTNDGDLAQRLSHPSHGVPKTYLAQVRGTIERDLGRRLRDGIELDDGPVKVDSFRVVQSAPGRALVELVIHEGRKHVVRRLLATVGHPVEALVRTHVGPISLGDLKPGKVRVLPVPEVGVLYASVGL